MLLNNFSDDELAIISDDAEKAYDSFEHSYVKEVLYAYNLPSKLFDTLKYYYTVATTPLYRSMATCQKFLALTEGLNRGAPSAVHCLS